MKNVFIHETAHISDNAKIGEGSQVWINVQIRENATIGENCVVGKDVYIDHSVHIGKNVKIQNGVSVYNGVEIADNVFVGPNVTFTNDYFPRADNADWEVVPTKICRNASLGANSTILCGVKIGDYSMVAAGSVVVRDVLANTVVAGNPAEIIGKVCKCGERFSKETDKCTICGNTL